MKIETPIMSLQLRPGQVNDIAKGRLREMRPTLRTPELVYLGLNRIGSTSSRPGDSG